MFEISVNRPPPEGEQTRQLLSLDANIHVAFVSSEDKRQNRNPGCFSVKNDMAQVSFWKTTWKPSNSRSMFYKRAAFPVYGLFT